MRERKRPTKFSDYEVNYTTNDAIVAEFNSFDVESMRSGDHWYPHSTAIVKSILRKSGKVEMVEEPIMIIHADVIKKVCEKGGLSAALSHLTKLSKVLGMAKVVPFESFLEILKQRINIGFNSPSDVCSVMNACKILDLDCSFRCLDLRDLVVAYNDKFMDYFPPEKKVPAPGRCGSLQDLIRFIRDDISFVQTHTGTEDVQLNNELLEFIVKTLSCKPPSFYPAT